MVDQDEDRKTFKAAILFADLVGYSLLMSRDEIGTLEFMVSSTRMIEETAEDYGGKLVQTTGDGFLILFKKTRDAVDFGVQLHRKIERRQPASGDVARFRVGIHYGVVHQSGGVVHGHAVNVAARLESEALPGSCVVSQLVRDDIEGSHYKPSAIGAPPLKNIAESIQLFRIEPDGATGGAVREVAVLNLTGQIQLQHMDRAFDCKNDWTAAALIAYLALSEGQQGARDKVASLFWPEAQADDASQRLGEVIDRVARGLGQQFPGLFLTDRRTLAMNDLHYETDLEIWLNDIARDRVPMELETNPHWPSKILDGLDGLSAPFDAWLQVVRTNWVRRIVDGLTLIVRDRPNSSAVQSAARAILSAEPGHEMASASLINRLTAGGNRVAALKEYDRICDYLLSGHGLKPSHILRRALIAINADLDAPDTAVARPAGGQGGPARQLLRIHVDGFADETNIAAAFREDLKANLAKFRDWAVVEGELRDDRMAGAAPDYLLGGVQKNREELSLFLKDLRQDRLLWAEDFSLYEDDPNAPQRAAIGRIAAHLETYISADRLAATVGRDMRQRSSHDGWLEAERIFARWTPDAADEAAEILRGVIARDPTFAPAYSSLASFENVRHIIRPGAPRDAEAGREAHGFARRAVEIDPLDARNQLAVAWTASLTGAFDRASLFLDMAEDLNPNDPSTLISSAMGRAFFGDAERAESIVAHARRISPMWTDYQWCYAAAVHFLSGKYEDALYAARMSGDRIVDNQGWIAAALAQLGRLDEAKIAFDALVEGIRPNWCGAAALSQQTAYDWFCGAYPLRCEADRARLANGLALVIGR